MFHRNYSLRNMIIINRYVLLRDIMAIKCLLFLYIFMAIYINRDYKLQIKCREMDILEAIYMYMHISLGRLDVIFSL